MSVEVGIRENGWATVEFGMRFDEREELARLGRDLILLASEDSQIRDALTFTLQEGLNVGNNNPTLYTVSNALNSKDDKLWLHAGYQTEQRALAKMPELKGIATVNDFFEAHNNALAAAEDAFIETLGELSGDEVRVNELFFPDDIEERVMHIRTVRYLNLDKAATGNEVIAGHGDMGFATLGIYETHRAYLEGAPMAHDWIRWDAYTERKDYIQELYAKMTPIEFDLEDEASFFFGCAVAGLNYHSTDLNLDNKYPSLYHAGFLPEDEVVASKGDWMLPHERVSMFIFLHPRLSVLRNPDLYHIPTVETCRPLLNGGGA
jgi:hypothetical protein